MSDVMKFFSESDDDILVFLKALYDNPVIDENLKNVTGAMIRERQKELRFNNKILRQSDRNQRRMFELNEALEVYKNHLEERVEEETQKRLSQEKMLQQQSKMAAMGEMMDAVAHQWKQPLNALSMIFELLESDYDEGVVDAAYILERSELAQSQIDHLIQTLNEFRTFFRPNKSSAPFELNHCIDAVLVLVKDEFIKHQITVEQEGTDGVVIDGIENEFKHLILNIINNSKDAFIENSIAKRRIHIRSNRSETETIMQIQDNAGGIPDHIIDTIFKPNVTSKPEGKGTGIGLYMSMQIVEKLGGEISAENIDTGACFTIILPSHR